MKVTLGALCVLVLFACDAGKEKHIALGRKAAKNKAYDEALTHFDNALAADGNDFNALWGKADVYRRDNNLPEQAKLLEKIMGTEVLGAKHGAVVKPALETNYRMQADAAMGTRPDAAEAFLRKAIGLRKKSDANIVLAQLLMRKGDDALKKRDFSSAEKTYKAALELRLNRRLRAQLKGKAEIAGFMSFREAFMPRFDAVKAELIEAGIYDEKKHEFTITVEADISDLDKKSETYEKDATTAGLVGVTSAIVDLTFKVAGKPKPEGARIAYSASLVTVIEKGFGPKKTYKYKISIPEDAVFEKVQVIDKGEFEIAKPKPEGGEEGGEEKKPEEGAPAEKKPEEGKK